jgi:DNA-binding SARP family transcriptional activator
MSATCDTFAVQLFGPLVVANRGRRLGPRDFSGVKPKQVLEILLAARGRRVPKDRLAELLWSEELPQNVAATLATYVSVMRRALEATGRPGHDLVVTETEAYRFATENAEVDLDRFDQLLEQAAAAPTGEKRRLLDEALALVHGDVLEDEPYADWAEEIRRTYRTRVLEAHLEAAEAALAERDHDAALRQAEAAVAIDKFGERAHRLTMLALYALGRQHEALDRYRRLRRLLDHDLGLEPMPETNALHAAVLRHDDVNALLPRPTSPSSSLAPPAETPPRLLGRAEELSALEGLVRRSLEGSFGLAVIEGEAGLGKSRLLDELSASFPTTRIGRATCSQLERHLPYVPLAAAVRDALRGVADPRARPALRHILPESGLSEPDCSYPEIDALEALIGLAQAHAPLLLILDDLHWADPATLGAISYLQRRCAGVPLAIVGAARSEEVAPDHPLRRLTANLLIELGPLTPHDLSPLHIPELHARTGGNPSFVSAAINQGTTRHLERTLAATLLARCRAEGPQAHALLLYASLLEDPFDPELVADISDLDAMRLTEELERLCDRGLLIVDGLGFRFRYEIYREVLRSSISPARQRILRKRVRSAMHEQPLPQAADPTAQRSGASQVEAAVSDPARSPHPWRARPPAAVARTALV